MEPGPTDSSPSGFLTLWLSALQIEAEAALALMEQTVEVAGLSRPCWRGMMRGRDVVVALGGVGRESCCEALGDLLAHWPRARVLLVGIAGALDSSLRVGDVIVAGRAVAWPNPDSVTPGSEQVLGVSSRTLASPEEGRSEPREGVCVRAGCIVTWDSVVSDIGVKRRLREAYGADCVDMESGYAARLCAERGTPFLAVRGISDPADAEIESVTPADISMAVSTSTLVGLEALVRSGTPR